MGKKTVCSLIIFVLLSTLSFGYYGFNPLELELGSSTENIEEEHPGLVLYGGDYRSFGTGKVSYVSEFYDGECLLTLFTKNYLIEVIVVSFWYYDFGDMIKSVPKTLEMMKGFDGNDKLVMMERVYWGTQKYIFRHVNYEYIVHVYFYKVPFEDIAEVDGYRLPDWPIYVSKSYLGEGIV